VHRFEAREDWWRVPEGHADKQRQARVERDPWHDLVMQYCEGRTEVQIPLIMSNCLEIKKQDADARAQHRIGRILRYAGWRNSVRWVGNKALRRWLPPNPADDPITNEGST
jgi:predicted P-loop ATPase